MQSQLWILWNGHGQLLGGGPMITIHADAPPGFHVYLSSLRIQKLTLPWGFSNSSEEHQSAHIPMPGFLSSSFLFFVKNWEFFMTHFIFCPSVELGSGFSDLDHTLTPTLFPTRMGESGHLAKSEVTHSPEMHGSGEGRRPWQHQAWVRKVQGAPLWVLLR